MFFRKKEEEPRTLLSRIMDKVNAFADDLEYATRRRKRIDRVQIERGVRSVLGVGNAVVHVLAAFFPSARVVSQVTKIMTLANNATDALSTIPKLEESKKEQEHPQQPTQTN